MPTITAWSNPVYSAPDDSTIDVVVTLDDATTHPYTVVSGDTLWPEIVDAGGIGPYVAPTLSAVQQAMAAMDAGLTLIDTATSPTLSGRFPVDPTAQQKIMALSLYIAVNGGFPGGSPTYPLLDMSGTPHLMASPAQCQKIATAMFNYVAALDFIIAGQGSTLPGATVTIA